MIGFDPRIIYVGKKISAAKVLSKRRWSRIVNEGGQERFAMRKGGA